jgi:hypothetical protein
MSHSNVTTPSKIARSIGVSVRTVQRMARTGEVPDVEKSGYHFVYRDTPALKAWMRKRKRHPNRRGNQKGIATRSSYDPNLWRAIRRSVPYSLKFLEWLETVYLLLPPPKRQFDGYTADDWRSLPLPSNRGKREDLKKGAQDVRIAAKIGRRLIEWGVFDPPGEPD